MQFYCLQVLTGEQAQLLNKSQHRSVTFPTSSSLFRITCLSDYRPKLPSPIGTIPTLQYIRPRVPTFFVILPQHRLLRNRRPQVQVRPEQQTCARISHDLVLFLLTALFRDSLERILRHTLFSWKGPPYWRGMYLGYAARRGLIWLLTLGKKCAMSARTCGSYSLLPLHQQEPS